MGDDLDELDVDAGLAESDPAGGGDESRSETVLPPAGGEIPPTAAHRRLGSEGVLRLRARHAEILARISERISDPARKDELKAIAERLNPDTWVTDDEVREGLEQYEAVFESLRSVLGRRRKRRRRGGRGGSDRPAAGAQLDSEGATPSDPDARAEDESGDVEPDGDPDDDESNRS
jgi:hypothetical protein